MEVGLRQSGRDRNRRCQCLSFLRDSYSDWHSTYIWASSTTDLRAPLLESASSGREAGCWYSAATFTVDFNFTDGNAHQVAIYAVDWDTFMGGRKQRFDVLDSNGNLLDTRSLANFTGGQYLVWNLGGHVVLRVTNTNGPANAVISDLLFGAGVTATNAALFVKTDKTTQGSWKSAYGSQGGNVIGDSSAYPSYVNVTPSGNLSYIWATSTSDVRAPQAGSNPGREAGCWYAASAFNIDLNFTDGQTHQFALYSLDWDNYFGGRAQTVIILDAGGNILDSRSISNFQSGEYLVWNLTGHVTVLVVNNNVPANAVISGLFFGPPA